MPTAVLSPVLAKGAKQRPEAVGASLIEASDLVPPLASQGWYLVRLARPCYRRAGSKFENRLLAQTIYIAHAGFSRFDRRRVL